MGCIRNTNIACKGVHTGVCVCTCVFLCVQVRSQFQTLLFFKYYHLTHGLLVICNSPQSSLAGQQALGISLSLALQLRDYKGLPPHMDYFTWVLRSQLRSLYLRSKPFPDKAVSPVPKYFKLRSETTVRNAKGR